MTSPDDAATADPWTRAKSTWSKFVRLQDPIMLHDAESLKKENMVNELALFGLGDLRVVINATEIEKEGLAPYMDIVLAHEVGHHVLAPGNLLTHAKLTSYVSRIFPGQAASYVVNVFEDLIINDFLFMQRGMPVEKVYKAMRIHATKVGKGKQADGFWRLYMKIYEILWRLPPGTLVDEPLSKDIDRDAKLAARVIRTYSKRWFTCLKNLAYIFKAYIPADPQAFEGGLPLIGKVVAGEAGLDKIWGFASKSAEEGDQPEPLVYDGALDKSFKDGESKAGTGDQPRLPTDYLNTLQYIGAIKQSEITKAMIQYYTELALPHVVPFPTVIKPVTEPIHEGTEQWTIGDDLDQIDILESLKDSPVIIPGVTTRKQVFGEDKGSEVEKRPVDVDMYLDASGSIGDPKYSVLYTTIAAFIIALSALRAGAAVQVTAWSGADQAISTPGFSRNKDEILKTILHYFGDGTQFPCQVLERYEERRPDAPPVHIIVVSDDDISSMIEPYTATNKAGVKETRSGIDTLKRAIDKGKASGSLLLRLPSMPPKTKATIAKLESLGFEYHGISDWKQIIDFARKFSQKHFGT